MLGIPCPDSDRCTSSPVTTKKMVTAKLPLRKTGRTHSFASIEAMGQRIHPCERTTTMIAIPRRLSMAARR